MIKQITIITMIELLPALHLNVKLIYIGSSKRHLSLEEENTRFVRFSFFQAKIYLRGMWFLIQEKQKKIQIVD